jgi:uncharacterized membrane protein YeaQ/YmgE (transglycosylase-associated protein family)
MPTTVAGMTMEYIAQMAPMLIVAGQVVVWLAQIFSKTRGYGFLPDMALGLGGSVLAGTLVFAAVSADAGMLVMFGIGAVGAALAIVAQRGLWRRQAPIRT